MVSTCRTRTGGSPPSSCPARPPPPVPGALAADELVLTNRRDIRRLNSLDYAGEAMGREAEAAARLHPDDAAQRGIADGDQVRITSAHGEIDAVLRIDPGVR